MTSVEPGWDAEGLAPDAGEEAHRVGGPDAGREPHRDGGWDAEGVAPDAGEDAAREVETVDPDSRSEPAAPGEVPGGTAPPVRSLEGTSETATPVSGIRTPSPDDPE